MGTEKDKFLAETIAKKVKEVMGENKDFPSVTIDANRNIHFKSKNMEIMGGPGATAMFEKAMKEEGFKELLKSDFKYIHPVTGKTITREQFDTLAKEQNWTEEEILNNLKGK